MDERKQFGLNRGQMYRVTEAAMPGQPWYNARFLGAHDGLVLFQRISGEKVSYEVERFDAALTTGRIGLEVLA